MIPFAPPRIDQAIIDEVVDTLKSGWITTGPKTKRFEEEITAYCGAKTTIALNSATAGLELVLRWFGVGEGDEVIIPAYTYSATANVVMHVGAKPVLVDTNANDFNINVDAIRNAITPKTKVIMPVDLAGLPCDYEAINDLVHEPSIRNSFVANHPNQEILGRILILADAAHSFGAMYQGKVQGSVTDIAVFSFHAVKNLTTAEGGAVSFNLPDTFKHSELYTQFKIKSLHGQTKDAFSKLQPGAWRYDIVEPGYKCNMTDIHASIGLVELARYNSETLPRRKQIVEFYDKAFAGKSWFQQPVSATVSKTSSYHLYMLRINKINEAQRDEIITLISQSQVSVNVHFMPIPMLSFYKNLGYNIADYPTTFDNYSREITLPVFYDLTPEQLNTIVVAVKNAVEQVLSKQFEKAI